MISVLTLNPAVDRTLEVAGFELSATNRVTNTLVQPAGKGINVCAGLSALSVPHMNFISLRRENARLFEDYLTAAALPYSPFYDEGSTRTNVKIHDTAANTFTELNESGNPLSEGCAEDIRSAVAGSLESGDVLVLTGSLPPGLPKDFYAGLIKTAAQKNVRTVLDTSGAALSEGLQAAPYIAKPNRAELSMLTDKNILTLKQTAEAAKAILAGGTKIAVVSLGRDGAMLCTDSQTLYCRPFETAVKTSVGAGDCMVAGIVCALHHGMSLYDMFALGCAAANASLASTGAARFTKESAYALLPQLEIEEL